MNARGGVGWGAFNVVAAGMGCGHLQTRSWHEGTKVAVEGDVNQACDNVRP